MSVKLSLICVILLLTVPFGAVTKAAPTPSDQKIDFANAHTYTSEDLYKMNLALTEAYPDLLEIEVLGYSYDLEPIYVLRLSNTLNSSNLYVSKMHGLIESGTHSREVANPVLTSRIIYDYVLDYINDEHLPDIDVRDILDTSVLHFVINSNPDGYNIAKFGINGLRTESAYTRLLSVDDTEYFNYKANTNGVDLNRNYPDIYYDIQSNTWIDKWSVKRNKHNTEEPSGAYYFGPYAGSEIETQIMMTYLLRYDFRYYLSYHSKGEVIFGNYRYLDPMTVEHVAEYRELASESTGYRIPTYYESDVSSGYMGDFIINNTLKPAITIETIPYEVTLPYITAKHLQNAYEQTYDLPYLFMKKAATDGYFNYRLYVDGRYVRDYDNEAYAHAIAKRDGGTIIEGGSKSPTLYQNNIVTRAEFLVEALAARTLPPADDTTEQISFQDISDPLITRAKNLGIVNGYNNEFHPERSINFLEASAILHRIDVLSGNVMAHNTTASRSRPSNESSQLPEWAAVSVQHCINQGYLSSAQDMLTHVERKAFETLMDLYSQ